MGTVVEQLLSWNVWLTLGAMVMAVTTIVIGYKNGITKAYHELLTAKNETLKEYRETDERQQKQIDDQNKHILTLQKNLAESHNKIQNLTELLTKIHKGGE